MVEFCYVKIKDIKKKTPKRTIKTFNIGVEDDESYCAKNIVVHNCRCRYIISNKGL
jgi:intein/homing endonuclease